MKKFKTVDLCDKYKGSVQVALPILKSYGKLPSFCGEIDTVKCYDDNMVVRQVLSQPGRGKVLVIDGGGSLHCALVGDPLAGLGAKNHWTGIVVNGCVRDVVATRKVPIGLFALGHVPMPPDKHGLGVMGVPVDFAGVVFMPGHYLYADEDGIVVSEQPLQE